MKARVFGICIVLIAILLCGALPVQAAFAEATPVILLEGQAEGEEIVVTVTLQNNDGISGMLLNLEYDRERLTLTHCERGGALSGGALSSLDLLPSGSYDVYPYVLTWSGDANDATNGKLLTIRFRVKEDANGEAFVRFSYKRDRDIHYIEAGDLKTRNLMTDVLKIKLSSGEATSIVAEREEEEAQTVIVEKKSNTALIVGLAVGGSAVIVAIVLIPWFVIVKKKRV